VIGEDTDWVSCTLEVTSPFFEHGYAGEHLFVMDFIVDLGFIHLSRVVGYKVQSSTNDFGENCADCTLACVSLNHHRPNGLEVPKYGSLGKLLL
jgi:hypothetical protein